MTRRRSATAAVVSRRPLGTPAEVSDYLQIPVRTLQQWRYLGTGPRWRKAGHAVRYAWDDVEAWLSAGQAS